MLKILTEKAEINAAQQALKEQLEAAAARHERLPVGFPGGSLDADVSFYPELDFWYGYEGIDHERRHWNAFGYLLPNGRLDAPVIEVNPPYEGTSRQVQGAFAQDDEGTVYLVHRGRPGGGRTGIGKAAFMAWYAGARESAEDERGVTDVLVVAAIGSEELVRAIEGFAAAVWEFKEAVTTATIAVKAPVDADDEGAPPSPAPYSDEFIGVRSYSTKERIEAVVRHGVVVRQLHLDLEKLGSKTSKDRARDLFIPDTATNTKMKVLFEVKTDATTTSVYTAVGQLLVHGGAGNAEVLVAVLPVEGAHWADRLAEVGIRVLTYRWADAAPVFDNLVAALK